MAQELKIQKHYPMGPVERPKETKTIEERIDEILAYPPIVARGIRDDLIVYDAEKEILEWRAGLKQEWLQADVSHLIMLNNVFRNRIELQQTRRY